MEVKYELPILFREPPFFKLTPKWASYRNQQRFPIVKQLVDSLGLLSAKAQGLHRPVTSFDKLVDTEIDQTMYIFWQQSSLKNLCVVFGFLKVGYKDLYLYDSTSRCFQAKPLCLMDFYIYDTIQRQGYGKRLFDYLLQEENYPVQLLAIDKPSGPLEQFLKKHYGLCNPTKQPNNFVVYHEFFDHFSKSNSWSCEYSDSKPCGLSSVVNGSTVALAANGTALNSVGASRSLAGGKGAESQRQTSLEDVDNDSLEPLSPPAEPPAAISDKSTVGIELIRKQPASKLIGSDAAVNERQSSASAFARGRLVSSLQHQPIW